MKIHFEATESRHHEGVAELDESEAAAYRELGSDAERTEWLRRMVVDLVGEDDHCEDAEIEEDGWHAFVSDD